MQQYKYDWITPIVLALALLVSSGWQTVSAGTVLPVSGQLTNDGTVVADGNYQLLFGLYQTARGGQALWQERQSVVVTQGRFAVKLGQQITITPKSDWPGLVFLSISSIGEGELVPRKPIKVALLSLPSSGTSTSSTVKSNTSSTISRPTSASKTETTSTKVVTPPIASTPEASTPSIDPSIVTLSGNQTLTNKTLTSPVVKSPTITGVVSGSGSPTLEGFGAINGLQISSGIVTTGSWQGTPISITYGGTGATSSQGAINALSQLTTTGDLLFYNGSNATRLARGSSGQCLTSTSSTLEWASCSSSSGDITAVGSITSGAAFTDSTADNGWLGLGSSAGRIEFDDQSVDEVNILDARVGVGTQTPSVALDVVGAIAATSTINGATLSGGTMSGGTISGGTLSGTALTGTGSFTITGGTASSELLTLVSTSHSTKGKIILGSSGYDEVNNRLGIATTAPTAALHLPASSTSASSLRIVAGTAPTSPNSGDIWHDDVRQAVSGYLGGVQQQLSGVVFVATGSKTVSNTTTETTIIGSGVGTTTLPANFLTVGKTIQVTARGVYSTGTSGATVRFKVKLGSTIVLDTTARVPQSNVANRRFDLSSIITTRTVGSSGTVFGQGVVVTNYDGTTTEELEMKNTSTSTINTTTTQAIDATITWGTGVDANDTITGTNTIIEVLN